MEINKEILAKKYAIAFFKSLLQPKGLELFEEVKKAARFIATKRRILALLDNAILKNDDKARLALSLFESAHLKEYGAPLIRLLIRHQRLSLIGSIMEQLCQVYRDVYNLLEVQVSTAVPLNEQHCIAIASFLEHKTHKKIVLSVRINKNLLGGIRIESPYYYWEHSIQAQLRNIDHILVTQGI